MCNRCLLCWILTLLVGSHLLLWAPPAFADDSPQVKALFTHPTRDYATAPLWVWNDMLTEDQVRRTLQDLAGQQVKQAFVHPRPGLMTPYLSDEWFRLWRVALDEAERLDMNLWIYDENSYPSGFAGGWVPQLLPESRGRGLRWQEVQELGAVDEHVLGVYTLTSDGFADVTRRVRSGENPPAERYLIVRVDRSPDQDWTANRCYVDLLHPGVTEKFIEVTMEAYRRHFGDQFGKRIPGWFTDEPHLSPFGASHWSDHLAESFRERWDYDLIGQLPSLHLPLGDWRRVRHNYYQLLLEQFIERWSKPCYEYCEKHELEFTGHYWEHGWPGAGHGGDNMAMYAWHQRPAIDNLMNQYSEDVNGQFGNSRTVKELSSVANQLGRNRTLCEAYGAGGWDLRFEDMKRIGDWLYVLGVNTLDEHLSYVTLRGTRKRDHPQSFSYHEPWWRDYHVMARYFTRLSVAMSHGQQRNEILIIEPTTTAWMYQPDSSARDRLMELGRSFQQLVNRLEQVQVEYDLGSEDIVARHGSVSTPPDTAPDGITASAWFVVGQRRYHTVVLPAHTENLNAPTVKLLEQFLTKGGRVLCAAAVPGFVDGAPSDRMKQASQLAGWRQATQTELPQMLLQLGDDRFTIHRRDADQGLLFHHRRQLNDGQLLLLVNTSLEHPSAGAVQAQVKGVEQWLPSTGNSIAYAFRTHGEGVTCDFDLPPCGSLLLWLSDTPLVPAAQRPSSETQLEPIGEVVVRRLDPNVLTLDFVDLTLGDQTQPSVYCYEATQRVFRHHGWQKNPWDHAVQFGDEIIRREFPADSGFRISYRFRVEQHVPADLAIVIERPDLYRVSCNGQTVHASEGEWWLDRAFGRIKLTDVAQVGENVVTLVASPMTVFHEIEPAYVVGDFALRLSDAGFAVVPTEPLTLGPWNEQGLPLYGHTVSYAASFDVGKSDGRHLVRLPAWLGAVAEVHVNDQLVGHLVSRPWQVDVTDAVRPGRNTIDVRVVGTLKNTLGPHHGQPVLGKAWPWDFRQAPPSGPPPGQAYHTVGYGLFADPQWVQCD